MPRVQITFRPGVLLMSTRLSLGEVGAENPKMVATVFHIRRRQAVETAGGRPPALTGLKPGANEMNYQKADAPRGQRAAPELPDG